ncbi:ABC transporter permease [Helicobacter pametensis]|uniref:ABC transporter permease n=1 Tax=Helicobacter pametensis TaxID=95149 RepID=UPI0004B96574|nr:iron ABC transporter permease [Helicobacter pametensis]
MRISLQILAMIMVGIIAIPIFGAFLETGYILIQSLWQDSQTTQIIHSNLTHFFDFLFLRFLKDTFWVATLVLLLSYLIGVSCAYLVAHFDFFFSKILEKILFLPLAIPAYILAFVYVGIFDVGGIFYEIFGIRIDFFNLFGVVWVLSISLFPYVYIFAKTSFQTQSVQLYEVAKSMKYTQWQIFYKVSISSAKPAIFGGLLLVLMETLSDYGASAYLGIDTFSAGIFKLWYDLDDPYSSSILTAILMVFVFIIMFLEQKVKQQKRYSFNQNTQILLQKEKLSHFKSFLASLYCFLIAFFGFLLPLAWLLYWGLQDAKLWDKTFYILVLNSFWVGILGAFFALLCALFLCFASRITKSIMLSHVFKLSSSLGYAIPGAVVGVSIMIIATGLSHLFQIPLLGTSISVLIFAYVVRFLATAIYSIQNGYDKIHSSIDEASLTLNPSHLILWFKIHFPLLKYFMLSAFLIVFIDTIKELPITRMLAPFGFETLATNAFWYATDERLYDSALPSLLIVLLSLVGMFLANLFIQGKKC